jgi:excisionase family DNA binding protein
MAGSHSPAVVDAADELITQQQVANVLKVTVATVRSMIDRGELRAYRVGPRAVRIRRSDLKSILSPIEATSLAEHVKRVVAQAPPLTDEQRDRIAAILRGGAV